MSHSQLLHEISTQPDIISQLISGPDQWSAIAAQIQHYQPRFVLIAARGTSDNAARYAQYLFGISLGWPVALATPALGTLYHADLNLNGALVIGVSQSGRSPDICDVLQRARAGGALTLAITNNPSSPLAQAAALHIDICAGAELSVAATKSYTNQLASIAMLISTLSGDNSLRDALATVPTHMRAALAIPDSTITQAAHILGQSATAISIGRGLQYATAYEAALKIKELSGLAVEAYSSADVLHGPVTIVERGFPVLISADAGATHHDTQQLINRLVQHDAQLIIASHAPDLLTHATVALPLSECDQRVAPLSTIVVWQRIAHATAAQRGRNADNPHGLSKITETR